MKPQKVLSYITPQIVKYQTIDDLLENNKQSSLFDDAVENLSIDNLLENCFVCIIGEPGIGKSRLTDEIKKTNLYRFILLYCIRVYPHGYSCREDVLYNRRFG